MSLKMLFEESRLEENSKLYEPPARGDNPSKPTLPVTSVVLSEPPPAPLKKDATGVRACSKYDSEVKRRSYAPRAAVKSCSAMLTSMRDASMSLLFSSARRIASSSVSVRGSLTSTPILSTEGSARAGAT